MHTGIGCSDRSAKPSTTKHLRAGNSSTAGATGGAAQHFDLQVKWRQNCQQAADRPQCQHTRMTNTGSPCTIIALRGPNTTLHFWFQPPWLNKWLRHQKQQHGPWKNSAWEKQMAHNKEGTWQLHWEGTKGLIYRSWTLPGNPEAN